MTAVKIAAVVLLVVCLVQIVHQAWGAPSIENSETPVGDAFSVGELDTMFNNMSSVVSDLSSRVRQLTASMQPNLNAALENINKGMKDLAAQLSRATQEGTDAQAPAAAAA